MLGEKINKKYISSELSADIAAAYYKVVTEVFNEIARLEKSHINGLNSFLKINSQRYNIAFEKLLNRNLDNPVKWGTGLGAKELFSGSMFKSMYKDLGVHFKSRYIKEAFGSYAMYLGGSPFKIPGFFSILPYGEIAYEDLTREELQIYHKR